MYSRLIHVCAQRSDDSLTLNNSLKVLLTITDSDIKTPRFKSIGITEFNCNKAKLLQSNRNFFATQEFFKQFKCGRVDLTQINGHLNKYNCLLLNVAFGNFWRSNILDIEHALLIFTGIDTSTLDFYLAANNIKNMKLFEQSGLTNSINTLAHQIQRPLLVIEKSKKPNIYYEIALKSSNLDNKALKSKIPLYLYLENNHVSLVYNFKLRRNSLFCQICVKQIGQNRYHHCKQKLCRLCKMPYNDVDVMSTENVCFSKSVLDTDITCHICNNHFYNQSCYIKHKQRRCRGTFCLPYYKCQECNVYVRNSKNNAIQHIHNNSFCMRCKQLHDKTELCYINSVHSNKKMVTNDYFFASIAFSQNGVALFCMVYKLKTDRTSSIVYLTNNYMGENLTSDNICKSENICLSKLLYYFQNINRKGKNQIFCTPETLQYLLNCVSAENSEVFVGHDESAMSVKIKNCFFKSIKPYINIKINELAFLLNHNIAKLLIPSNVTDHNIVKNAFITVTKNDYDISVILGTKIDQYRKLKEDLNKIEDTENYAGDIFITVSKYQFNIYIESIFNLLSFYERIKSNLGVLAKSYLFEHVSLAQAGNYLFRSCLEYRQLPVIDQQNDRKIKNSSKIEYCAVTILKDLHMITCGDITKIRSTLTNNGEQYRVSNLSADIVCFTCNSLYYINGAYKTQTCNFGHKQQKTKLFFGKSKKELVNKFNANVTTLLQKSGIDFNVTTFNQCCIYARNKIAIKQHILQILHKHKIESAQIIVKKLLSKFVHLLSTYNRERYEALQYRSCTNLPFVCFIKPYFMINSVLNDNKLILTKYDLKSAFPTQLKSILLPCRDKGEKYVFDEADLFLNTIIQNGDHERMTGFCRAKITPPLNNKYTNVLPFFSYRHTPKSEAIFTLCRTCAILQINHKLCTHSTTSRQFYINTTLESLIFAKENLGYVISLSELFIYKNNKVYESINAAVCSIEQLRMESKFYKHVGKNLLLQSIGSFSVNSSKYMKNSSVSNYTSLVGRIENAKATNSTLKYSFYGAEEGNKHCIITSENKIDTGKKYKSPKINLLIYTLCSNLTRIQIYKTFMQLLDNFVEASLIRIDADAISISYPLHKKSEIENLLHKKGFNIEKKNLRGIVSFKQKSYLLLSYDKDNSELKTCGLSLALTKRFEEMDYLELAQKFLATKHDDISKLRRIDATLKRDTFSNFINSSPYGARH